MNKNIICPNCNEKSVILHLMNGVGLLSISIVIIVKLILEQLILKKELIY